MRGLKRAFLRRPSRKLGKRRAMTTNGKQAPSLVWHGADRPRIEPGTYIGRCTGFQGPEWVRQFSSWKLRLEFVLDPDDHRVSEFYSFGTKRDSPHVGVRSKYYRTWVLANGGPPQRGQPMPPELITDPTLIFTVEVSDATTDGENRVKEDALVYSRVKKILRVERTSNQEDTQVSWQAGSPF